MAGTKIFVLQMKDLIRMSIFAVLGLALVIVLLVLFIPKSSAAPPPQAQAQYIPGTYSASIILNDQALDVRVTVSDNAITAVEMTDMAEVQRVFYPLFEPTIADLAAEVLQYQTSELAYATEYPVTSGILQAAITTALNQAYVK